MRDELRDRRIYKRAREKLLKRHGKITPDMEEGIKIGMKLAKEAREGKLNSTPLDKTFLKEGKQINKNKLLLRILVSKILIFQGVLEAAFKKDEIMMKKGEQK